MTLLAIGEVHKSGNKLTRAQLLTQWGVANKAQMTAQFL
jgi:hypothetical protein